MTRYARSAVTAVLLICAAVAAAPAAGAEEWTRDELDVLRSLWIGSLPDLPPDPSNGYGDDERAAELGHRLFFDTRLSANGKVACASCHMPELAFTDGRAMSRGVGSTIRNAPTVVGTAYSPWFFWDGRKDSQWSQALGPLENPVEHGVTRADVVRLVRRDADYRRRYSGIFGSLPEPDDRDGLSRAFANIGKAIAAYERRLLPGPSRFDRYVAAVLGGREPAPADRLTMDEVAGLRVFIADNQGQCTRCHNGPLFTNNHFHNIGVDPVEHKADGRGRLDGIRSAAADEFNCLGIHSDAPEAACSELRFAKRDGTELLGGFKTPTLRNLSKTAPYMHAGQLETLDDVLWHYRETPRALVGQTELHTLTLTNSQFEQLKVFLLTLDGPVRAPAKFLRPPDEE